MLAADLLPVGEIVDHLDAREIGREPGATAPCPPRLWCRQRLRFGLWLELLARLIEQPSLLRRRLLTRGAEPAMDLQSKSL